MSYVDQTRAVPVFAMSALMASTAGFVAYSTDARGEKIQYNRSIDHRSTTSSAASAIAAARGASFLLRSPHNTPAPSSTNNNDRHSPKIAAAAFADARCVAMSTTCA